jgi:hypothetical protein
MPVRSSRFALLFVLCAAAPAREVYKCTTPHGDVAYQDRPCATSASETVLHVSDAPPSPAPEASSDTAPAAPAVKPLAPVEPRRPRKPLPSLWLCTNAEDGSHYATLNGPTPPRLVPLGTLGYPGKSLAEAYKAGANVMSAPELSRPPIDRSPGSALATGLTQVQDACALANADQTCAYLREQFDQASDKLRRARFKDEQAQLQPQVDQLEDDLGGC